ncbi:tRNA (adenosine(37)-N6)-threonylcarbamoyltransferase complex transferase subunit TsaD [Campylobacter hyointestinalis]|uniref:tRNA (adenosine(37)-N6)-threonylcarbamoyltransferase complex transferase subunit TsaD n=1 Tax=Campylobacter hyointestinalis TaxID=198 RepID=UPI000DCB8118|nr:tRNA (adenosine(37)-N6)-threonylcarbamoyltransferase complex transferase subunit TsaD [Campylobacter hyointestinalis]RAZ23293.1 tRNA (adenosine(37)-N6)-threonylcarbamoyltransferase complex transferase subunit TsaD [Campylobacter hyointestinalis subsp. lawsonii]RAZ37837.1 tRNA (adenosine(37)-N6)-threonylcarbamoyltransferase complex transferase subunit TsaD [Campylobacter hyointestinalis subsp. lawsonii]RAZ51908.1 tRNA (adenosine(37)-N6)-threonylcarbamoyltransferase complex transferase subunit 
MILGIESSCDDSSVALMKLGSFELKFYKKITQENEHSRYGGVVPELAARLHTAALPCLIEEIKPYFSDIKAIAVTNEPGLSVSLISGVSVAKSLSVALNLPIIAVNHLIGHIYSLFLDNEPVLPLGVLLVSGGHTLVLNIDENGVITILATTSDDSFGESFDKVAKMMNLGYPGGEIIQNLAKSGDKNRFKFSVPLKYDKRLEYSFSGLKNQVRVQIANLGDLSKQDISDVAACFEETAVNHIIDKLEKIFDKFKFKNFGVVGGASANLNLRNKLEKLCSKFGSNLLYAPLKFCSDNAAMIARAGATKFKNGEFEDALTMQIHPRSNLELIRLK